MFASKIAHCAALFSPRHRPATRCSLFTEPRSISKLSGLVFLGTGLRESGVANGYFLVRMCRRWQRLEMFGSRAQLA